MHDHDHHGHGHSHNHKHEEHEGRQVTSKMKAERRHKRAIIIHGNNNNNNNDNNNNYEDEVSELRVSYQDRVEAARRGSKSLAIWKPALFQPFRCFTTFCSHA